MADPTAALRTGTTGPYPAGPEGMLAEPVTITGNTTAAGANVDYTMQFINDPKIISPGYTLETVTKTGPQTVVSIKTQHAIAATDTEDIEIIGYMG